MTKGYFSIWWKSSRGNWEKIDSATSLEYAMYLANEYRIAYHGDEIEVRQHGKKVIF